MNVKNLYFLAIIPPDEISNKLTELKKKAKLKFRSQHALKSPPHITLVPPFWLFQNELELLKNTIANCINVQKPFELSLNGFGCFAPRVIYISNKRSDQLLNFQQNIFRETVGFHKKSLKKHRIFTPHMTIAFKDLDPDLFNPAWKYFSSKAIDETFQVNELYLLKHEDRKWHVSNKFPFGSG